MITKLLLYTFVNFLNGTVLFKDRPLKQGVIRNTCSINFAMVNY